MAEHEPCIGASDDWYTPPEVFEALRLTFDLDPCSPGPGHWVPSGRVYTKGDDGLSLPWHGMVFMNPPFGSRHGHVPWLVKFFDHANGVAIVRAYTSSDWWHDLVAPRAETILFPRGKTKFIRGSDMWSDTKSGRVLHRAGTRGDSPGHGVALIGMGAQANAALARCGLGLFIHLRSNDDGNQARTDRSSILNQNPSCTSALNKDRGAGTLFENHDEQVRG